MIKSKLLLTSLLSTVTVTGSLLLTSVSPTQAIPCSFGKKGMSPTASGEPSSLVGNKIDLYKKFGIAGVGIAAVAGGFVAVKKLKACQSQPTEATVTDTPESFEIYNFAIPVPPEAVAASTPEAEASERDVTSVS